MWSRIKINVSLFLQHSLHWIQLRSWWFWVMCYYLLAPVNQFQGYPIFSTGYCSKALVSWFFNLAYYCPAHITSALQGTLSCIQGCGDLCISWSCHQPVSLEWLIIFPSAQAIDVLCGSCRALLLLSPFNDNTPLVLWENITYGPTRFWEIMNKKSTKKWKKSFR